MAFSGNKIPDPRMVTTGMDGRVFFSYGEYKSLLFAECSSFKATATVNTETFQFLNNFWQYGAVTGGSLEITLEEIVISSDFSKAIFDSFGEKRPPYIDFEGVISRRGIEEERVYYKNCIVSGNFDLQNIVPGQILRRSWTFIANGEPDFKTVMNSNAI